MASKNWRERLNLAALTDEAQEEYLRARRRRGFSRPLIFIVVVVASIFALSLFFRVEDIQVEGNTLLLRPLCRHQPGFLQASVY